MLWRRALAATSAEGGMPGRMVRSQEPKASQTRCGKATAGVLQRSLADGRRLDEDVVGVQLAPDGVAVFG